MKLVKALVIVLWFSFVFASLLMTLLMFIDILTIGSFRAAEENKIVLFLEIALCIFTLILTGFFFAKWLKTTALRFHCN